MSVEFKFRRIAVDLSGYYYPNWDRAVPITVIAEDENEARNIAPTISGECSRGRGWGWRFRLDSVGVAK
jgi:hypothetical protein